LKVPENYSRRFRLAYPNEELPAARPVRRSPIYERLKAAGAVMGANFALEQALWFAPPGVAGAETPTYRRSEAFPIVRAEARGGRLQALRRSGCRRRLCARDPDARRIHGGARVRGLDHPRLLRDALLRHPRGGPRSGTHAFRRPGALVAAPREGVRLIQQGLP